MDEKTIREYLRDCMPSREDVKNFIDGKTGGPMGLSKNRGWMFDAELGWVLSDSVRYIGNSGGMEGTATFYTYEKNGARKTINYANRPCRINTYGDSITHCDQVSDCETWQEYLAGHFQEPVRNYGVGGYGAYQAYRRMLRVEQGENAAEYVILNIWDDDHYRSLDPWRTLRFRTRTVCGFTLPHIRVNLKEKTCEERENVIQKPQDVYKLCDEDFVYETFKDDPVLQMSIAAQEGRKDSSDIEDVTVSFGLPKEKVSSSDAAEYIKKMHTEAALLSSQYIVTKAAEFAKKHNKKFMLVLSTGLFTIIDYVKGLPRFDQSFIDWLKDKPFPVVDSLELYAQDFKNFNITPEEFVKRYYIGHQSPAGNFFTAYNMLRKPMTDWLDPKPLPYQKVS